MRKIKVLHLIHDLKKGGGERFALDVVSALDKMDDVEVRLGVFQRNNQYPNLTDSLPIEWLDSLYTPSIKGREILENEGFTKLVDEFQPDIIHTHLIRAELMSSTYINPKIIYVTHCHDNMEEFENFSAKSILSKRKLTNLFEKYLLRKNKYRYVQNYFIVNSENTRKYFEDTVPHKYLDNIELLQCGFDFHKFYNPSVSRPYDKIRMVNIGSFMTKKNQKLLVLVAKELADRNIDFELVMLGDGEHREEVAHTVEQLGLSDKVKLKGIVHEVEKSLWDSNIYIHSAYYEPFGIVFLEAMAAGLPIITLDGKGNQDLIENSKNGYMIMEQNPKEFADRIIEIWNDKQLYERISNYSIEYARKYDLPVKTAELVDFYKKILSKNETGI